MRVFGIAGWSGSGKTVLITRLIPALRKKGLSVSTIKHAHHSFNVDIPGKDSYEHREAGAQEVLVSSARRWVVMHEIDDEPELSLKDALLKMSPVDLVLIEGFKRDSYPKIEVWRATNEKPNLWPEDPHILGVASDDEVPGTKLPVFPLEDISAIAEFVIGRAAEHTEFLRDVS